MKTWGQTELKLKRVDDDDVVVVVVVVFIVVIGIIGVVVIIAVVVVVVVVIVIVVVVIVAVIVVVFVAVVVVIVVVIIAPVFDSNLFSFDEFVCHFRRPSKKRNAPIILSWSLCSISNLLCLALGPRLRGRVVNDIVTLL